MERSVALVSVLNPGQSLGLRDMPRRERSSGHGIAMHQALRGQDVPCIVRSGQEWERANAVAHG
jgi:hypothetical protein